ncbi:MAG: phosphoenolpyruvate--protein phosphotransferase [Alkaliphilus sp.]
MNGISASPGIALGKVVVFSNNTAVPSNKNKIDQQFEIKRLKESIEVSNAQIEKLRKLAISNLGEKESMIFEAHQMMLKDPEIMSAIEKKIRYKKLSAENAVNEVTFKYINLFNNMNNEYMKERASDIKDVMSRVVNNLMGINMLDISKINEEVIIVAHDLTPSETVQMNPSKVIGFITEIGGKTSHSAIMARTLGIPAIVGVGNKIKAIKENDFLVFDGSSGEIFVHPTYTIVEKYKAIKASQKKEKAKLNKYIGEKTISKDGFEVTLEANIGTPRELSIVHENDAKGIGLFRTEFLYMGRSSFPSEDEQFSAYKEVLESLNPYPVVIRTLDIGGDKQVDYFNLPKEMNPFLGYRAIRICLEEENLFKTQLRALYRSSIFGNLKIMFPMVSSLEEIIRIKEVIKEVKLELEEKQIVFNHDVELGIMIEIPAVAIISDKLAKEVDFFSIGTNDLLQYTVAVDRMNQNISHLYNQYHPALLRLIKSVIENGKKAKIKVAICGETAGNPKLVPIFLGMGLREFSMSPSSILKTRKIISKLSQKEMQEHAEAVTNFSSAKEVESYIERVIRY